MLLRHFKQGSCSPSKKQKHLDEYAVRNCKFIGVTVGKCCMSGSGDVCFVETKIFFLLNTRLLEGLGCVQISIAIRQSNVGATSVSEFSLQ